MYLVYLSDDSRGKKESSSSSSKGTLYTITRVSSNDRRLFEYDTLASSFGPSRSVSWSKMSGEGYLAKALYHFSRDIGCLRHSLRFCAPDVIASTITRMYYRGESGKWHFVRENIFGIHASSSSEIRSQTIYCSKDSCCFKMYEGSPTTKKGNQHARMVLYNKSIEVELSHHQPPTHSAVQYYSITIHQTSLFSLTVVNS